MTENPYQILGLEANTELETIKQVYRQQIRKYHPDTFSARKRDLERTGDSSKLRALEKEIQHAKIMTQRINAAYALLSDADLRAAYDRKLSQERQDQYEVEVRRQRNRHQEVGRRTVKSRPHRQNPQAKKANFPLLLFGGFLMGLFIVSAILSNGFFRNIEIVEDNSNIPTRAGEVGMNDLQATTNARQATLIARATNSVLPTSTPRSAEDNERLGDRMLELGQYQRAIEAYNNALLSQTHSRLYFKRGRVYLALYYTGDESKAEIALADFERALELDATNAEVYRERGWFYYQAWLVELEAELAAAARRDFETYLDLVESDAEIETALEDLPD